MPHSQSAADPQGPPDHPSTPAPGTPGHLFVAQGDLGRFAVDDVIVPCDEELLVTHGFSGVFGLHFEEGMFVPPHVKPPRRFTQPGRLPINYGRVHPRGPRIWLVNSATPRGELPLSDSHLDWLIVGLRTALERIAHKTRAPANGRSRRLIGIPLLGIGTGGFNHIRGQVLTAYVAAVMEFVSAPGSPDVVIVARERSDYAALQAHRPRPDPVDEHVRALALMAGTGDLVVFLGAGVSSAAGLPDWNSMLLGLARLAGIEDPEDLLRLPAVDSAELIARRMHSPHEPVVAGQGTRLQRAIAEQFQGQRHSLAHALLASLRLPRAITTNYDTMYEDACQATMDRGVRVLPHERLTGPQAWLLKLHGDIRHPGSIVLTRGDYMRLDVSGIPMAAVVQASMVTHHMLFLGYSLSDDNFIRLARQVADLFAEAGAQGRPVGTVLTLGPMPYKEQLWDQTLTFHDVTKSPESEPPRGRKAERERTSSAARDLEIVLDQIAQLATSEVSYALDPRYDSVIPDTERDLVERLAEVAGLLDPPDHRGAISTNVARMLAELGWTPARR